MFAYQSVHVFLIGFRSVDIIYWAYRVQTSVEPAIFFFFFGWRCSICIFNMECGCARMRYHSASKWTTVYGCATLTLPFISSQCRTNRNVSVSRSNPRGWSVSLRRASEEEGWTGDGTRGQRFAPHSIYIIIILQNAYANNNKIIK